LILESDGNDYLMIFDSLERLTAWANFQGPFTLHGVAAAALGLRGDRLRLLTPPDSGGSFGIKSSVFAYVVLIGLAARHLGVPVTWIEDRLEHLAASAASTGRTTEVEILKDLWEQANEGLGQVVCVIGEAGLTTALHEIGYVLSETNPDYVVLGETQTYSFEAITKAIRLIDGGARFIATNPDPTGPSAEGPMPACGAVAALITRATRREPYIVGKPNPMMFRSAMNRIDAHSESTAMIGDRMDTDVIAGMEAGLETYLVLTGVTTRDELARYPFRPTHIVDSIADIVHRV